MSSLENQSLPQISSSSIEQISSSSLVLVDPGELDKHVSVVNRGLVLKHNHVGEVVDNLDLSAHYTEADKAAAEITEEKRLTEY